MDRRRFIRQSAEVAALSLFAGVALDDVVNRVIGRVGEIRGIDKLGQGIATNLNRSGGIAFASEETTDPAANMLTIEPLNDSSPCY